MNNTEHVNKIVEIVVVILIVIVIEIAILIGIVVIVIVVIRTISRIVATVMLLVILIIIIMRIVGFLAQPQAIAAFATEQLAAVAALPAAPPTTPAQGAPMEFEISFPGDFDSLSPEEKEEFKAQALKEILERTGLSPEDLEDLVLEPGSIIVKAKFRDTSLPTAQAQVRASEGPRMPFVSGFDLDLRTCASILRHF